MIIDYFFVSRNDWEYWTSDLMFDSRPNFDFEFNICLNYDELIIQGSRKSVEVEQIIDKSGKISYIPVP